VGSALAKGLRMQGKLLDLEDPYVTSVSCCTVIKASSTASCMRAQVARAIFCQLLQALPYDSPCCP